MTQTLENKVKNVLLKYGLYHDKLADELGDVVETAWITGFTTGMKQGYYEGLKACPASYQKDREDMRKEVDNNIGQLRQWLNEKPDKRLVTSWEITQWLFPEDKKSVINGKDKKSKIPAFQKKLILKYGKRPTII